MMKKPIFTGVCTALVTPFLDGKVNYPMMELLLRRQLETGIKAVVISGTTGESPTLSDDEKLELFRRCKAYVGDEMLIIAGTGSNSTEHAVYLSKEAEKCGVDALLVVSPYYNKATPDGLIAHYLSIAHAVKLPVILYNVPSRTGVDIPVSVYKTLSRIPNIAGVKEASTDVVKITRIRAACGSDLPIWSGNDDMIAPIAALGGKGVISVLSNVLPKETVQLCQKFFDGDIAGAMEMQKQYLPLIDALFSEVNPIPAKAAMAAMGFCEDYLRLPLVPMEARNREVLLSCMRNAGLDV